MAKMFDDVTFNKEVIEEKGKVLVDFYADWCAPCKMMAPVIDKIAEAYEGQISVGKLNIDNYPDLAVKYKVMSIPTLILFENGEKAESVIGLVDKSEIENMIKKHIQVNI